MRRTVLPVHPRLRHPLTGEPIVAVGFRKSGSPIWPIIGASEGDGSGEGGDDGKPNDDGKPAGGDDGKPKGGDDGKGFPADTPWQDMEPAEQAAYWRHQAQKHEGRTKDWAKLGKTPADVQKMIDDAKPDSDKALEAAREEGRAETRATANAAIVSTVVDTLIPEDKKREDFPILDALDLTKFTKDDGTVDTAKVRSVVQSALGTSVSESPGDTGQGKRGKNGKQSARDAGAAEAERRFASGKK